jgi:phage shock protein A
MQQITDEYNIDGAVSVFDKTAGSIQQQADKLSAMDTLAVSEGEDLDRQLAAISKKTEVDDALEALKARIGEGGQAARTSTPAAEKQKVSSAFEDQK